jgi:hypothetical protein
METDFVTEESIMTTRKDRTLRTLFQVICQDDEFSLLNETLRLYLEEIGRQTADFVD